MSAQGKVMTPQMQERDKPPSAKPVPPRRQFIKAKEEAYVFIRFKSENIQRAKNACAKEKRVMECYGGRVLGIAQKVTVYEGNRWPTHPDFAILVMQFSSRAEAVRWIQSDRIMKQQDWPLPSDSLDIILAPMQYIPSKNTLTFQMVEFSNVRNADEFQAQYVDKAAPVMDKFDLEHGVVATMDVESHRGCWHRRNTFVLVNRAASIQQLESFYDSADYRPLKKAREQMCETSSIAFTLDNSK